MTVIAMSRTEIDRMRVLQDLAAGRVQVAEAATLMGLGRRQVYRLAKAYHHRGPAALVSRKRRRPSNRSYPADIRPAAIAIIREHYADFGPTLATEKLAELHGICLARETVCQWIIAADLWKDRRAPGEACASTALSARLLGRADPDRWIGALVVRGSRAALHPARLHR
jgi:hypothetical protein